MTVPAAHGGELPHALRDGAWFAARMAGRRPAVFLDYDGTLAPIVDRPEDAVIADSMREAVQELARRCPVCVVSGRDRVVVQRLMGIDDLVVAGSHGFDIWDPRTGTISHDAATGFENLLTEVGDRLRTRTEPIEGVLVEPKRASVAVHFRLATEPDRSVVQEVVAELLASYPDRLKITPGKMVYEIQPKLDWHKGKAVLHLLHVLDLDSDHVVPLYLGDDITDEDVFLALGGRGIGIVVAGAGELPRDERTTNADFVLNSTEEVERFLRTLAQ